MVLTDLFSKFRYFSNFCIVLSRCLPVLGPSALYWQVAMPSFLLFLYFYTQYSMPLNIGFWKSFHGRVSGASCAQGLLATLSGIWLSGPLWWLDSLSSMRRLVCHIGLWSLFSSPVIAATPNRAKLTRPASCWHSYKILSYNFRC